MRRAKGNARTEDLTAKIKGELNKKSCDSCALKKRKCDGGNPCRRCVGAGDACSYSKRRTRLGRALQPPGPVPVVGWASDPGIYAPAILQGGGGESAAFPQYGSVSLKRCRLSPSPATGLVGMQENAFLSDYFGCFSFLPLTSQSNIRETLVKMFAASVPVQHSDSGDYSTTQQHFNAIMPTDSRLLVDPSTCVFWSAVALGSLVQGRPVESVAKYSRMARDALLNFSGPASTEVARAWAILAYMSDFCGDHVNFHGYLQRANNILCDVGAEEFETLPVGLAEVVNHGASVKIFVGDLDREEVESFCNQQRAPPQMSEAATEGDICQFVMRSFRSLAQAIYENVVEVQATAHGHEGDGETRADIASGAAADGRGRGGETRTDIASGDVGDADDMLGESHPHLLACLIREQGPSPCPPSIQNTMRKMMRKHSSDFYQIEQAAAGPNIRGGIGGLIINGTLVFEKVARKDFRGALEKLDHCGEVLERYPGLCRFTMGAHITHMLVSNLVVIDGPRARGIYDQMRAAYNSARRPGSLAIPPFDEWQGVSSCCDHYCCRVLEQSVAREYGNASSSPPPRESAAEMQEKGPRGVPADSRQQWGIPSATGSGEGAEGNFAFDTRPQHEIIDASRSAQEPERVSDEEHIGCLACISSDGRRIAHTQPPEVPLTTPLFRKVGSEPTVDSDVCRSVDEQLNSSSCEETGAEAAEALLLSEMSTEGTAATGDGTEYDAAIGVEDWLDVTHAMLDTGGFGPDF